MRLAPPAVVRTAVGLAALFLLAVGVRAWGLDWGVPGPARYYPYHPDEAVLLQAVCAVNPLWGDFTPGFYNYGSLYIFLCRLGYDFTGALAGWGAVPRMPPFSAWMEDFGRLLLVGRWISVLLGAATVPVVWALGRRLFGDRAAWWGAAFLALAPMPVLLGHYMTVDVAATFFSMLALLFAAFVCGAPPRRVLGLAAAAGFAAGLGVSSKYSAFPALLPFVVPLWQLFHSDAPRARPAAAGAAAAVLIAAAAAFVISTPGVLLDTQAFVHDVQYEMELNRTGMGKVFEATPWAGVYHLTVSLPIGLEWPLYLLSLAGVVWALRRRTPGDAVLLLFLGLTFLLLAPAARKYVRYVLPLVPALALLAGRLVSDGLGGRRRSAWIGAGALALGAASASSIAHLGVLAAPDSRDQAAAYLRQHAEPTDIVALGGDAWFYTPPIDPTAGCVKASQGFGGPPKWEPNPAAGESRRDVFPLANYRVLAPPSLPPAGPAGALSAARLREHPPRYVVVSDYEYDDPQRIRRARPGYTDPMLTLLQTLDEEGYRVERAFRPRPSLFGFTWWRSGVPPVDWRYPFPEIRIYARAPAGSP
jgi:hypothetical protein